MDFETMQEVTLLLKYVCFSQEIKSKIYFIFSFSQIWFLFFIWF